MLDKLKIEYYFENPVKSIARFGSEIIKLIRDDIESIKSLPGSEVLDWQFSEDFLIKLEHTLATINNETGLNELFEENEWHHDYNVEDTKDYFILLLKELVTLDYLKNKKNDYVNELNKQEFKNTYKSNDKKKILKEINSSLYQVRQNIATEILGNNYQNSFLKKILPLACKSTENIVVFKAKLEDNQKLLSIIYRSMRKLTVEKQTLMLDREMIFNCLLGTSWSKEISENHSNILNNLNYRKYFTQFYFTELKVSAIKQEVDKLLVNYKRGYSNLDVSPSESLPLNLLNIHVLRTVSDNVKDSPGLSKYVEDTMIATFNDIKVSAYALDITDIKTNSNIIAWSFLLTNLNIYKTIIYERFHEDFEKYNELETIDSLLPHNTFNKILSFINNKDYDLKDGQVFRQYQNLLIKKLEENLETLRDSYGNIFMGKMLSKFDCSALSKFDILKQQWLMESAIPIHTNIVSKSLKF